MELKVMKMSGPAKMQTPETSDGEAINLLLKSNRLILEQLNSKEATKLKSEIDQLIGGTNGSTEGEN